MEIRFKNINKENLEKRKELIEKLLEEEINRQKAQVAKLNEERVKELERISGLTSEQAKEYLLKTVEEDVKLDTAKLIKEMEHKAKEEADKKAKEYVVTAIHHRRDGREHRHDFARTYHVVHCRRRRQRGNRNRQRRRQRECEHRAYYGGVAFVFTARF